MIEEVGLFYSLSVLDEWIELSKAMIRTVYIKGNVEALARFEDLSEVPVLEIKVPLYGELDLELPENVVTFDEVKIERGMKNG